MTFTETLSAVVPVGKNLLWLAGVGASMFLAGVGFMAQAGPLADMPERVTSIEQGQVRQNFAIDSLRNAIPRILCLSRLSATGQVVDPLEIDEACP